MELVFQQKEYLYFLIAVPLFVVSYIMLSKKLKSEAVLFANYEALLRIKKGITNKEIAAWRKLFNRNIALLLLETIILTVLILALAHPIIYVNESYQQYKYMIAIDSSFSMQTMDITPTRYAAAKDAAKMLIEKTGNATQVGLLVFSAEPYIIKKPEQNIVDVNQYIDTAQNSVGVDTNILKALLVSANLLLVDKPENKIKYSVVLMTDGADTFANNESLQQLLVYYNANQISIIAVGVGTDKGGMIQGYNITYDLKLDEDYLKNLAALTNGEYFRIDDSEQFTKLVNKLIEKQNIKKPIDPVKYMNYSIIFLLLIFWLIISPKYRSVP